MSTIRYIGETKKGICYEIQVSRGYGKSPYQTRWYPKPGWSQAYIDKELKKVAAEFETQCHDGKVKTKKEQKEDAVKKAAQEKQEYTVQRYAEEVYLPAVEATASNETISNYKTLFKIRIIPQIGEKRLNNISAAELESFILGLQKEGLSTGTAQKYYAILSAMFKRAYRQDTIDHNPMDKVNKPKAKKSEGKDSKVEFLSEEETQKLLKFLETAPLTWKAMIKLMLDTGIRKGEAFGLMWKNVDFENNQITISQTLNYTTEHGVYLDTTKTGKSRIVDVDSEIMDLLQLLKNNQAATVKSKYVFSSENSAKPMHPHSLKNYLNRIAPKIGVEKLHPHMLRHTWTTIAITNGADVKSVSARLGHSDAGFTLRQYAHADQKAIKKAGDIFRQAITAGNDK